jgi:hypothetical protein
MPPGYDLPFHAEVTNVVSMISLWSARAGMVVVMNLLCELGLKGSVRTIVWFPDTPPCHAEESGMNMDVVSRPLQRRARR